MNDTTIPHEQNATNYKFREMLEVLIIAVCSVAVVGLLVGFAI